jgi:hypothetical protein
MRHLVLCGYAFFSCISSCQATAGLAPPTKSSDFPASAVPSDVRPSSGAPSPSHAGPGESVPTIHIDLSRYCTNHVITLNGVGFNSNHVEFWLEDSGQMTPGSKQPQVYGDADVNAVLLATRNSEVVGALSYSFSTEGYLGPNGHAYSFLMRNGNNYVVQAVYKLADGSTVGKVFPFTAPSCSP